MDRAVTHGRRMDLDYKCYAYGHDDQWEAICVDLDISVVGRSFDEVRSLLEHAIATYVRDAMEEEPDARSRLLDRRAPFTLRLRLAFGFVRHVLRPRPGTRNDFYGSFGVPCRA